MAVGDDVALNIEEPGPRPGRLDQAPHHLPGEIRKQDLPLVDRIENGTLTKGGGENLALHFQRFDLLADEARLVLAEIEKSAGEKSQRQYVDGEDAPGQG